MGCVVCRANRRETLNHLHGLSYRFVGAVGDWFAERYEHDMNKPARVVIPLQAHVWEVGAPTIDTNAWTVLRHADYRANSALTVIRVLGTVQQDWALTDRDMGLLLNVSEDTWTRWTQLAANGDGMLFDPGYDVLARAALLSSARGMLGALMSYSDRDQAKWLRSTREHVLYANTSPLDRLRTGSVGAALDLCASLREINLNIHNLRMKDVPGQR